jgi:hypothetical protein
MPTEAGTVVKANRVATTLMVKEFDIIGEGKVLLNWEPEGSAVKPWFCQSMLKVRFLPSSSPVDLRNTQSESSTSSPSAMVSAPKSMGMVIVDVRIFGFPAGIISLPLWIIIPPIFFEYEAKLSPEGRLRVI